MHCSQRPHGTTHQAVTRSPTLNGTPPRSSISATSPAKSEPGMWGKSVRPVPALARAQFMEGNRLE